MEYKTFLGFILRKLLHAIANEVLRKPLTLYVFKGLSLVLKNINYLQSFPWRKRSPWHAHNGKPDTGSQRCHLLSLTLHYTINRMLMFHLI